MLRKSKTTQAYNQVLILTCRLSREVSGPGEKETNTSWEGIEPFSKVRLLAQLEDSMDATSVKQVGSKCAEQRAEYFDGLKFGRCFLTNEVHF